MDCSRLDTVPNGAVHLDTVRALHQTVVSLRTALEVSKNELKELKEKYEQHSKCNDFTDVIEKLTIENHVLRRKIIDAGYEDRDLESQNIKLEVTYSPHSKDIDDHSEVIIQTSTADAVNAADDSEPVVSACNESDNFCSTDKLNASSSVDSHRSDGNISQKHISQDAETENVKSDDSQISNLPQQPENVTQPVFKTKLELLSKFDVRIKVQTVKEGIPISSSTSDTDSTGDDKKDEGLKSRKPSRDNLSFEDKVEHFEEAEDCRGNKINVKTVKKENIKMAVPNEADAKSKIDKFDVQVRITSEENLVVKENTERSRRKDTLNLDVDDLSLRSLSEGDNSVFSEGGITPLEPTGGGTDDKLDQDNASGNESEEVDDIELIFTTDESKDISNLQEDLVSIRETDNWGPPSASTHSTPVLIKFHTIDSDFQPGGEKDNVENENQENSSLQGVIAESSLRTKRVSLPSDKEIRHVAFNGKGSLDLPGRGILKSYENKSDNMLYKRSPTTSSRRLDSIDSLTCEYNRGLSFDNTKSSSFELGSSMDILHRDESVDSFNRPMNQLGHRFSIFAETDISKCGISEDDLSVNLNVRRNTCPNPFQYRPSSQSRVAYRTSGPLRAGGVSGSGPGGIGLGRHARPVLRDAPAARRSAAAQTDVCALPNRWSSDGYLAHKMAVPMTTLPQRSTAAPRRPSASAAAGRAPPASRANDTRRVLLSDIGFTSMVPELSRSADPVWALGKRMSSESPAPTSTAKFMSRGSSFRSPCFCVDRYNEWIPQTIYTPSPRLYPECRAWRSSLPDVRRDETDELLEEAEIYVRRSIDNLRYSSLERINCSCGSSRGESGPLTGQPYIPREPKNLRLGHTVKVIAPNGRLVIGRVRYVGVAGGTAATSSVVVGGEFPTAAGLPRNDGVYRGRRYFLTPTNCTALFVPFSKVVMAWAN